MESTKQNPAFPLTADAIEWGNRSFAMQGVTKLEWFAARATERDIQGYLANHYAGGPNLAERRIKAKFDYAEAMVREADLRKMGDLKWTQDSNKVAPERGSQTP